MTEKHMKSTHIKNLREDQNSLNVDWSMARDLTPALPVK